MPTVTGSNPDQGGERSVLFQTQYLSKLSAAGASSGNESWSFGSSVDVNDNIPSSGKVIKYGEDI